MLDIQVKILGCPVTNDIHRGCPTVTFLAVKRSSSLKIDRSIGLHGQRTYGRRWDGLYRRMGKDGLGISTHCATCCYTLKSALSTRQRYFATGIVCTGITLCTHRIALLSFFFAEMISVLLREEYWMVSHKTIMTRLLKMATVTGNVSCRVLLFLSVFSEYVLA